MESFRGIGFVPAAKGVAVFKTRPARCSRVRPVVCAQPAPIGTQTIDLIFFGSFIGLAIGAGFLIRGGFDADITTEANRTEGLNMPRVLRYNAAREEPPEEPAEQAATAEEEATTAEEETTTAEEETTTVEEEATTAEEETTKAEEDAKEPDGDTTKPDDSESKADDK